MPFAAPNLNVIDTEVTTNDDKSTLHSIIVGSIFFKFLLRKSWPLNRAGNSLLSFIGNLFKLGELGTHSSLHVWFLQNCVLSPLA